MSADTVNNDDLQALLAELERPLPAPAPAAAAEIDHGVLWERQRQQRVQELAWQDPYAKYEQAYQWSQKQLRARELQRPWRPYQRAWLGIGHDGLR